MPASYKAPVLLFTYRKPQFLEEIFQAIKRYSPPRLYVASNLFASEKEKAVVETIRSTIRSWELPGEIIHLFHDKHLLINDSIHYGLDYIFSIEESAIILEDDTVPSSSFFAFCNTMLDRYQDSDETGSIIGCNLGAIDDKQHVYRVPLAFIYWGWATWAKKWQALRNSPLPFGKRHNGVADKLQDPNSMLIPFFQRLDDRCTWDVRWGWQQAIHNMRTILPGKNLIQNKGFVEEGSYVRYSKSEFSDLGKYDMDVSNIDNSIVKPSAAMNYETKSSELLSEVLMSRGELGYYTKPPF
jgi:hypothetical protein